MPETQPSSEPVTAAAAVAAPGNARHKQSVAFFRGDSGVSLRDDDVCTKADVARSLAALLGIEFIGDRTERPSAIGKQLDDVYWVPSETLDVGQAASLGIHGIEDFFGGAVPHPFVGSKVITHPLIDPGASAPAGWSHVLGEALRDSVLPGFSAFSLADATAAGTRILEGGAVRIKQANGVGGAGQTVATSASELRAQLGAIDPDCLRNHGVVLEKNLLDVTTCSVGQVIVGQWLASYVGTQRLTANHRGDEVYGGSTLTVVRGDYTDLLRLDLEQAFRTAVAQALAFDSLVMRSFPSLFASRRNYDVVQGVDEAGTWTSGVLEQSWRVGGASGAEVAALSAFRKDPAMCVVQAETHEHYGEDIVVPAGALIHFDGRDKHGGRLVKFAQVAPYAYP
jgi:Protein of unknown function (DUF3182)